MQALEMILSKILWVEQIDNINLFVPNLVRRVNLAWTPLNCILFLEKTWAIVTPIYQFTHNIYEVWFI